MIASPAMRKRTGKITPAEEAVKQFGRI